jgi:hypothetical protein
VKNAGLDGTIPVSICDIAPIYAASPTLRSAVNVTFTNTFPFWEATPIEDAGEELETDLSYLLSLPESSNKRFVLGETGWPASGYIDGVGIASGDNQKQYFIDSYCLLHVEKQWEYYWFTGITNEWRQEQDPNNSIEGTFGFLWANRTLRNHFVDLSFTCPQDGVTYSFSEIDWSIPTGFTNAPIVVDAASCSAHTDCIDLLGNCCPNDDGLFLGCCGDTITTITPTESPTSMPSSSLSETTEIPTLSSPTLDNTATTAAPTTKGVGIDGSNPTRPPFSFDSTTTTTNNPISDGSSATAVTTTAAILQSLLFAVTIPVVAFAM